MSLTSTKYHRHAKRQGAVRRTSRLDKNSSTVRQQHVSFLEQNDLGTLNQEQISLCNITVPQQKIYLRFLPCTKENASTLVRSDAPSGLKHTVHGICKVASHQIPRIPQVNTSIFFSDVHGPWAVFVAEKDV